MKTSSPFTRLSGVSHDQLPDARDAADFKKLAVRIAENARLGVMTTIDQEGLPHARWMGTLSFADFPVFHALTSPHSRKVGHLDFHPAVNWMFSTADLSVVINFSGVAEIIEDMRVIKRVWRMIEDKTQAWFLSAERKGAGVAVIETKVDRVECSIPQKGIHVAIELNSPSTTSDEEWRQHEKFELTHLPDHEN